MCGIFGLVLQNGTPKNYDYDNMEHDVKSLFLLSQIRGQDSAGMALTSGDEIKIFRRTTRPSIIVRNKAFKEVLKSAYFKQTDFKEKKSPFMIIGQCRLVTDGSNAVDENNQPVYTEYFAGVHNGIILNINELVKDNIGLEENRKVQLPVTAESVFVQSDTKLFFSLIDFFYRKTGDLVASLSDVFQKIEGAASIALLWGMENKIIIASNTGSLYYLRSPESGNAVFASESKILRDFLIKSCLFAASLYSDITQVKPGNGIIFEHSMATKFNFNDRLPNKYHKPIANEDIFTIHDIKPRVSDLKRCTRCVLPSTYPFISFDEKGGCNFCRIYEKQKFRGEEELEKILSKYRSKEGRPDCLVGISGGRDSSYGLHILKTQYGMNPIAYTYDWGLTTDTSRRNQAKVCGKLGIEHIIRAPDIMKKRRHIRKNIYAWLKSPKLGMVPLFIAGDKDFYHYGRQLRSEVNVKLTILCSGYLFEQREFFVGFCGIKENVTKTARLYHYNKFVKFKLALWYILQYIKNPRYINESFFDSIRSYFTSFIHKDDFLYLYEYLPWEEKRIEAVLREEYGWEDYKAYGPNQWRMGDGQTAFTNYIFYTIAGFSEFDNFRSRQIREGFLTREEALKLVKIDNEPKYETLQYFSYLVGFNLSEVLAQINSLPKLY